MEVGSLEPRMISNDTNNFKKKKLELIDLCGGTGDISFQILELSKLTRHFRNSINYFNQSWRFPNKR